MSTSVQRLDLVFVTGNGGEAETLVERLQGLNGGDGVWLQELVVDEAPGAVDNQKIVAAVLAFAVNVSASVVGSAVYELLKDNPNTQCVAGETPIGGKELEDLAALGVTLRAAAKPMAPMAPAEAAEPAAETVAVESLPLETAAAEASPTKTFSIESLPLEPPPRADAKR